jgi:hypothetical protein
MAFATLATIISCLQLENKDLEKRKNCDLLNIFQNVSIFLKITQVAILCWKNQNIINVVY